MLRVNEYSHVNQIQLPADGLHAHRDTVGVDDHGDVEEQEVEARTLGTSAVLQALDGIESLQRSETPGKAYTESKDGKDGSVCEVRVVCSLGGERSQHDVKDERAEEAVEHHGPATEFIEQGRTVDGGHHGKDGVDGVDQ